MPEGYHAWKDRELLLDHEADPESFRQPIITKPMTHAQIVAGYSDNAIEGIIHKLTISGQWTERLNAAKAEIYRREREDAASEAKEQYEI